MSTASRRTKQIPDAGRASLPLPDAHESENSPAPWRPSKIVAICRPSTSDSIPTRSYGANSAWQQLVVLAPNLLVNLPVEAGAIRRSRTPKRTAVFRLRRAATLRVELFHRAGILVRPAGVARLRLLANEKVQRTVSQMLAGLAGGMQVMSH